MSLVTTTTEIASSPEHVRRVVRTLVTKRRDVQLIDLLM